MPAPKVQILVLKLGALGDVVRTSYILPGLHERFGSGTHITWVTAPAALPILRFNPYVSELISTGQGASQHAIDAVKSAAYDWVLSFDDEVESCGIATQVSAKRISGALEDSGKIQYTEDTREWFDMGLISRFGKARADELKIQNTHSHDAIFARMLGIRIEKPGFFNDPKSEAVSATMLQGLPRKIVGLNLGAGTIESGPARSRPAWPTRTKERKSNGLSGSTLTPGAAVNRRFRAGMRHDLQKGRPNATPSTAFGPPVDWR